MLEVLTFDFIHLKYVHKLWMEFVGKVSFSLNSTFFFSPPFPTFLYSLVGGVVIDSILVIGGINE